MCVKVLMKLMMMAFVSNGTLGCDIEEFLSFLEKIQSNEIAGFCIRADLEIASFFLCHHHVMNMYLQLLAEEDTQQQ